MKDNIITQVIQLGSLIKLINDVDSLLEIEDALIDLSDVIAKEKTKLLMEEPDENY